MLVVSELCWGLRHFLEGSSVFLSPSQVWEQQLHLVAFFFFYDSVSAYWTDLHACLLSYFSLTLCDPIDCSPPVSSVPGILSERILECFTMSPPEDLPHPETEAACLTSPALADVFFTSSTTWEVHWIGIFPSKSHVFLIPCLIWLLEGTQLTCHFQYVILDINWMNDYALILSYVIQRRSSTAFHIFKYLYTW